MGELKRMTGAGKAWLAVSLLFSLPGCVSMPTEESPNDPRYAPLEAGQPRPDFRSQGGIQYAHFGASLFSDRRAMRVGDIVTVRLTERTAASKDADTQITKDNSIALDAGPVLGATPNYGNNTMETNLDHSRDFQGQSQASQSNSLNGNITVTVVEEMPNGLLRVRGEKWLKLNRGDEFIRLTGIIRPEDIAPDNTVASTKIADARISYSGTGEFAQSNNMGWLGKFFNSKWWPL